MADGDEMTRPPAGTAFRLTFDGFVPTGTFAIRSVQEPDRPMGVIEAQKAVLRAARDAVGGVCP